MEMMDRGAPHPPWRADPVSSYDIAHCVQRTSHVLPVSVSLLWARADCAWVSSPCTAILGWVCVSRGREGRPFFFILSRRWNQEEPYLDQKNGPEHPLAIQGFELDEGEECDIPCLCGGERSVFSM